MIELAKTRKQWQKEAMSVEKPELEPLPAFIPKCPNLPQLSSYKGILSDEYWSNWEKNDLKTEISSWIDPYMLWRIAWDTNFYKLQDICQLSANLCSGFNVGTAGAGRIPARGENLPAFYANAYKATDAIQAYK